MLQGAMYNLDKNIAQDNTKTLVARHKCYELLYDSHTNRLYLSIYGFWKNNNQVADYITDIQKTTELVKPGFTLLLDMRTMITHPQTMMGLHIKALEKLQEHGLKKSACVDPADRIANLQVEDTLVQSHLPSRRFTSYEEAEFWLDDKV